MDLRTNWTYEHTLGKELIARDLLYILAPPFPLQSTSLELIRGCLFQATVLTKVPKQNLSENFQIVVVFFFQSALTNKQHFVF